MPVCSVAREPLEGSELLMHRPLRRIQTINRPKQRLRASVHLRLERLCLPVVFFLLSLEFLLLDA